MFVLPFHVFYILWKAFMEKPIFWFYINIYMYHSILSRLPLPYLYNLSECLNLIPSGLIGNLYPFWLMVLRISGSGSFYADRNCMHFHYWFCMQNVYRFKDKTYTKSTVKMYTKYLSFLNNSINQKNKFHQGSRACE